MATLADMGIGVMPRCQITEPPELEFETRVDRRGNQVIYFPFQTISDIHWGTRHCRAKKLAHMLRHTTAERLYLIGDIIDGEYLIRKKYWKFGGEAHREGIAHICRKAAEGAAVFYIPGNHEEDLRGRGILVNGEEHPYRNLCGKSIFDIQVREQAWFVDVKGRRIHMEHGDRYDDAVFGENKGFLYFAGDVILEGLASLDAGFQALPKCGHILPSVFMKRATKTIINDFLGVHNEIVRTLDADPLIDIKIYGHSHMEEMLRTPGGKLLINDGCCTEHVMTLVQDRNGTLALLEWHDTYVKVRDEYGRSYTKTWKELGLESICRAGTSGPQPMEDEYLARADRLIRLSYRMWPPKERQQMFLVRDLRQTETTAFTPLRNHHYPDMPLPRPCKNKPQLMIEEPSRLAA